LIKILNAKRDASPTLEQKR